MNGGTKIMTNYQIIEKAKVALVMSGKIEAEDEIHTFQGWKERGFKVRKGEHAITRFSIWKYTSKVVATKDDGTEISKDSCFLKDSCWFSTKQVEAIA